MVNVAPSTSTIVSVTKRATRVRSWCAPPRRNDGVAKRRLRRRQEREAPGEAHPHHTDAGPPLHRGQGTRGGADRPDGARVDPVLGELLDLGREDDHPRRRDGSREAGEARLVDPQAMHPRDDHQGGRPAHPARRVEPSPCLAGLRRERRVPLVDAVSERARQPGLVALGRGEVQEQRRRAHVEHAGVDGSRSPRRGEGPGVCACVMARHRVGPDRGRQGAP